MLRTLALASLLLLPIQMRAGAASPHPHALLHLALDASDGAFDHHAVEDEATTSHDAQSVHASDSHPPDIPTYGTFIPGLAGLAVLTLVTMPAIPTPRLGRTWPLHARWRGRIPALDPPPPRLGCL